MSDLFHDILETFQKVGLWEDGVELIGSWSFLLYQRHCGVPPYPLRTQDIDFLLPRPYPERTRIDLAEALAPLGFRVDFAPGGAIYFIHPELKIEFITPERGKGDDQPRSIKPLGIKAVQLRYMDMLFEDSLIVKEGNIAVRIPNPLNFCLHKLIIAQQRRKADKATKDIEQAVHVLSILKPEDFLAALQTLPKKWRELIMKSLRKAWGTLPLERPNLERLKLTLQS